MVELEPWSNPLLIPVGEAAKRLGIGRTLLYRLLESGDLPSLRIGRCRRVRVTDLDLFIDRLAGQSLDSDCGY